MGKSYRPRLYFSVREYNENDWNSNSDLRFRTVIHYTISASKFNSIWYSQVVTILRTNEDPRCLTSVIERKLVFQRDMSVNQFGNGTFLPRKVVKVFVQKQGPSKYKKKKKYLFYALSVKTLLLSKHPYIEINTTISRWKTLGDRESKKKSPKLVTFAFNNMH